MSNRSDAIGTKPAIGVSIPGVETFHARSVWEQKDQAPIKGLGYTPPTYSPFLVTHGRAHYTAAKNLPDGDAGENIPAVLRFMQQMQSAYRRMRGYSLGYNFAVDWLGGVWEIRGWDYRCAANNGDLGFYKNINLNRNTFAVLFLVDGADRLTALQAASGRAILAEGKRRSLAAGGTWKHDGLLPHSESDSTACPGDGIRRDIAEGLLSLFHKPVAAATVFTDYEDPEGDDMAPYMWQPAEYVNVFLITSAMVLHLTPATYAEQVKRGVVHVREPAPHKQGLKSIMSKAGLSMSDLVPA